MLVGLLLCTAAAFQMSQFSLEMDSHLVVVSGLLQGLGTGMIFVPLSTLAFSTLSPPCATKGRRCSAWCATWAAARASR